MRARTSCATSKRRLKKEPPAPAISPQISSSLYKQFGAPKGFVPQPVLFDARGQAVCQAHAIKLIFCKQTSQARAQTLSSHHLLKKVAARVEFRCCDAERLLQLSCMILQWSRKLHGQRKRERDLKGQCHFGELPRTWTGAVCGSAGAQPRQQTIRRFCKTCAASVRLWLTSNEKQCILLTCAV